MKNKDRNISSRKLYSKPLVTKIVIDYSVSIVMKSFKPPKPRPRGGGDNNNPQRDPFASPFDDGAFK